VIRQLCPHCQQLVELPDSAAGSTADCPLCSKLIVVPAAYAPSVATGGGLSALPPTPAPEPAHLPPPPGLKPEVLNPPPAPDADAVPPTVGVPTGYGRVLSLTFSPAWLAWVPVACVTFAFVLTLFTWASTYAGGVREYSQNPWWALFGDMSTNPVRAEVKTEEPEINKLLSGNRWLIVYLPLLMFGTFLMWVERVVKNPTVATMPGPLAWVPGLWPKRFALLTLLTGVLLVFLTMQGLRGFGLETALREKVASNHVKQVEEAVASNSTVLKQNLEVQMNEEFAKYHYQTTFAFKLAVLAHLLAFVAMLTRWWLSRRGAKPYPRFLVQW
jgi:hypothetical protein